MELSALLVARITAPPHQAYQPMISQFAAIGLRGVLRAAIGLMYHAGEG